MPPPDPAQLRREIARAESELARLDGERTAAERRLGELRRELDAIRPLVPGPYQVRVERPPDTRTEKVALFRSLFAGRTDVFPRFWRNARARKEGYAPACANEWVRGVCEKPRVKCGECPSQAFLKVTDQAILDHLQGRQILGVYPLLGDETCWFLAVDFDKGDWPEDVAAYVATCRLHHLDPAVERSRSGNGAHVWFFFSSPVPAGAARGMACYLLTETTRSRPGIPMSSYDRLFPNQDTMPRGGFGNLIALPLQYEARKRGHTVFVDDAWRPYADQWAYLAALPRLEPARVEEIARDAGARGRVLGVRAVDNDEEDATPWLPLPFRAPPEPRLALDAPAKVRCVLAQMVFVDKTGLPPALIDQINRLAAFQNPQFYEKQALRLSTALTPRIISCAEDRGRHIGLPRGCLPALVDLLRGLGIEAVLDDQRRDGEPLDMGFQGELTALQRKAADELLRHEAGVLSAPPGAGKTVVGVNLIAKRGRNALIIVHRTQLLDQWRAQLALFLDLKPSQIGQIGGGRRKATGFIDVAMIQSLVRKGDVNELLASYGHVIVDECHHVPAVSFERVMREVRARYITGLTATPRRRDGHHPILEFQLGPIRFSVDPRKQATRRPFEHRLIVRETSFRMPTSSASCGIQDIYGQLAADEERNEMILNDLIQALEDGRSPVLLTERRDHLAYIESSLTRVARNLVVLQGGMGTKRRREARDRLASIPEDEERVLLATGRFLGEGFDDARLDTLFLTMPVAWKGTLVQYAGRLHRMHQGKTEVRIFDYVDRQVPVLARMFEKRLRGCRAMGYEMAALPEARARRELVIEYDDEVEPRSANRPVR
jgi:superfamily II DNA or RNA helicase